MSENNYKKYHISYLNTIKIISEILEHNKSLVDDNTMRELIVTEYKKRRLDPDGKAIRLFFEISCTADGLHSIKRICLMEKSVKDIITVYKQYRSTPIFFFPRENGGINQSRFSIFGDRIDYTLYDLKLYYSDKRQECRLIKAYNRPKTKAWLEYMESFENIIDWWGVKNIFTDSKYNVIDLERDDNHIIEGYKEKSYYKKQWSIEYYNNLKEKIKKFIKK